MSGPDDPHDKAPASMAIDVGRHTLAESDPPTGRLPRGSFRELHPGTVVDEIYEIDAKLGAGAMGEVYAARHIKLGKRVAIKVIGQRLSEDVAAIERFAMEARTLAQIQHPAIVTVEHVGELADGRAYFIMEFMRGESLFERLQRGRLPLPEALRILDQMARGLDAAHGEGIVHRDVKPENTFLVQLPGEPPLVKIVDFGLSTLRALDQRAERTLSGVALGTPMYMSPEQARGPDVDHRTDIYALGCVAYELLLGRPPFPHAQIAPALYAAHLYESPPLPRSIWPEIPPQLDLVLFAMLAKDPTHRPTLAQVRSVLTDVRPTPPSQRATTERNVAQATKTPKTMILGVATATLIFGVVIGAALTSRSHSEMARETPLAAPTTPSPVPDRKLPAVTIEAITTPAPTSQPQGTGSAATPPPMRRPDVVHVVQPAPQKVAPSIAPAVPVPTVVPEPAVPDGAVDITTEALVDDAPAPAVSPQKTTPKTAPRPTKPIDRNQTMNPFAPKHPVDKIDTIGASRK